MDENLEIGKRYTKVVTFSEWGPGQSMRTANYGAEYLFTLSNGIELRWDTMSRNIFLKYKENDNLIISFKVIGKSPYGYKIRNVRLVKSSKVAKINNEHGEFELKEGVTYDLNVLDIEEGVPYPHYKCTFIKAEDRKLLFSRESNTLFEIDVAELVHIDEQQN